MKSKISKLLVDGFLIVIGAYIMSVAINLFLLPNKITTGGASGVGTIMYYLFDINISLTILIINIPLFIIALKKLGFSFSFKSIVATLLFTIFLQVFTYNGFVLKNRTDMFISSVYGGLLLGLGMSLIFKAGACSRRY